jgi:hypothetical protein
MVRRDKKTLVPLHRNKYWTSPKRHLREVETDHKEVFDCFKLNVEGGMDCQMGLKE